jgi:hypothetical protein
LLLPSAEKDVDSLPERNKQHQHQDDDDDSQEVPPSNNNVVVVWQAQQDHLEQRMQELLQKNQRLTSQVDDDDVDHEEKVNELEQQQVRELQQQERRQVEQQAIQHYRELCEWKVRAQRYERKVKVLQTQVGRGRKKLAIPTGPNGRGGSRHWSLRLWNYEGIERTERKRGNTNEIYTSVVSRRCKPSSKDSFFLKEEEDHNTHHRVATNRANWAHPWPNLCWNTTTTIESHPPKRFQNVDGNGEVVLLQR